MCRNSLTRSPAALARSLSLQLIHLMDRERTNERTRTDGRTDADGRKDGRRWEEDCESCVSTSKFYPYVHVCRYKHVRGPAITQYSVRGKGGEGSRSKRMVGPEGNLALHCHSWDGLNTLMRALTPHVPTSRDFREHFFLYRADGPQEME